MIQPNPQRSRAKVTDREPQPIRVAVVGEHPWSGEFGFLEPKGSGYEVIQVLGRLPDMYKVKLNNGHECYASKANLRSLPE